MRRSLKEKVISKSVWFSIVDPCSAFLKHEDVTTVTVVEACPVYSCAFISGVLLCASAPRCKYRDACRSSYDVPISGYRIHCFALAAKL